MTECEGPGRSRVTAGWERWSGFWFTPEPAYALGLVRIAFGALAVAWTLTALADLRHVFSEGGAAPVYVLRPYQWSVFQALPGDSALLIGWILLLVSAVAMTVGWHARIAAVIVFVLLYSLVARGAYVYNSGDSLIVFIALVLALSPCGAALSLDQRRRSGSFRSALTLAPWSIRLLQVQTTVIYLFAAQAKLGDKSWVDGSAMFYTWHTDGMWAPLPAPEWLSGNAVLVNAVAWSAMLMELAIAILVWNRRCRPWVLLLGVVLHLAMMLTLNIGYFSFAVYVLYLAFVPWETVQRLSLGSITRRLDPRRGWASVPSQSGDEAATP